MSGSKKEKLEKAFTKTIAAFVEEISNKESMVTVTRVEVSKDLKNVTAFISVFPTDREHDVVSFLERRRWDARDYLKKHVVSRVLPFIAFKVDEGEKNRQHIDQLLKKENY